MTLKEFDNFLLIKDVYLKNSSTKSTNEGVLDIYSYILKPVVHLAQINF